jgi:hypothetical protein
MAGVLAEMTGGMRLETSIGGKKENCDFASGPRRCQPIYSQVRMLLCLGCEKDVAAKQGICEVLLAQLLLLRLPWFSINVID